MPGPNVPFPPQEALLVDELPSRGSWQYEPKWDGFRGVLENDGGVLALWSRNGRPLLRYFPELRALGELLPPHSALDGEIVIEREGRLEFDLMQLRLHPADSRIRKLSAETPATYIVFDILLWEGAPLHQLPLEERRRELEAKAALRAQGPLPLGFVISPQSRHLAVAQAWLNGLEAAGLDGVICKRLGLPYLPGSRDAVVKVKRHKTADCVIVGYRTGGKRAIGALLLGLYRDDGTLDFVGHTSGIDAALQQKLGEILPPLVERTHGEDEQVDGWGRTPGGLSRWSQGKDLDWVEVRPAIVCEVRYDKLEGERFRHGTRFLRFRPDKDPRECTWAQVRPPRRAEDLTVGALLRP